MKHLVLAVYERGEGKKSPTLARLEEDIGAAAKQAINRKEDFGPRNRYRWVLDRADGTIGI